MTHEEFCTLLRVERARRNLHWPVFCDLIGVPYRTVSRWLMADDNPNRRQPKPLTMEAIVARLNWNGVVNNGRSSNPR